MNIQEQINTAARRCADATGKQHKIAVEVLRHLQTERQAAADRAGLSVFEYCQSLKLKR